MKRLLLTLTFSFFLQIPHAQATTEMCEGLLKATLIALIEVDHGTDRSGINDWMLTPDDQWITTRDRRTLAKGLVVKLRNLGVQDDEGKFPKVETFFRWIISYTSPTEPLASKFSREELLLLAYYFLDLARIHHGSSMSSYDIDQWRTEILELGLKKLLQKERFFSLFQNQEIRAMSQLPLAEIGKTVGLRKIFQSSEESVRRAWEEIDRAHWHTKKIWEEQLSPGLSQKDKKRNRIVIGILAMAALAIVFAGASAT